MLLLRVTAPSLLAPPPAGTRSSADVRPARRPRAVTDLLSHSPTSIAVPHPICSCCCRDTRCTRHQSLRPWSDELPTRPQRRAEVLPATGITKTTEIDGGQRYVLFWNFPVTHSIEKFTYACNVVVGRGRCSSAAPPEPVNEPCNHIPTRVIRHSHHSNPCRFQPTEPYPIAILHILSCKIQGCICPRGRFLGTKDRAAS